MVLLGMPPGATGGMHQGFKASCHWAILPIHVTHVGHGTTETVL